jgi:hypothetical protein
VKDYRETLTIENPLAVCGHCRFTTALDGEWAVEDGRLVFRAAGAPLDRRGPGLESCCESDPVVEFRHIEVDGKRLSGEDTATLRATMREAQIEEARAWTQERQR